MRISIVSYMGYDGPGVMHAHNFANRLVDRGHEVVFLLNGAASTAKLMQEPPRYRLLEVSFRKGVLATGLRRSLDRFDPEIVHLWTPRHLPARAGLEAWLAGDARLLIHYEDDEEFILGQSGGGQHFGADDVELYRFFTRQRPDPGRLAELVETVDVEFLRETVLHPSCWAWIHPMVTPVIEKLADGLTAISKAYLELLDRRWSKPIRLLYPGVDMERFRPRDKPADLVAELELEGRVVLLYSGAIAPIHDFTSVLEGLSRVVADHPGLVLVQIGKNHIPQETHRLVEEGGIRGNVRFIDQVPHHRMPDHLALADLFVGHVRADDFNLHRLPSKIPEYMAAGRPILVADHGFGRELEEGAEAVKVAGDDPAELAGGIRRALAMRDSWPAMGERLRRKAARLFDWDRNTDDLAAFYDELRRTPPVVAREGVASADPLTLVDLGYLVPRVAAPGPSADEEPLAEPSGPDELSLGELAAAAQSRVVALRDENLCLTEENRRLEAERKRLTEVLQIADVQLRLLRKIPLVSPIWRLIRRLKYPHLASPGRS